MKHFMRVSSQWCVADLAQQASRVRSHITVKYMPKFIVVHGACIANSDGIRIYLAICSITVIYTRFMHMVF